MLNNRNCLTNSAEKDSPVAASDAFRVNHDNGLAVIIIQRRGAVLKWRLVS